MIINNSISADSYTERAERLQLLSTNIDTFAVELDISGAKLAAVQNADAEWDNACAKGVVEAGQMDEAYEEFNKAVVALTKHYAKAKAHLLSIIAPAPGNTMFAWVTAFDDGEESEPCGPVSIDIM